MANLNPTLIAGSCILGSVIALTAAGRQQPTSGSRSLLLTAEEKEILSHQSIVYLDDGQGGTVKTLRFTGINVQIVDGSGTTDGPPTGLGNLIVGYNELEGSGDDRTGSHNIVAGRANNYTRFGGLVVGSLNSITGDWASVSGGGGNVAGGYAASVSGGFLNTATGSWSSVSGGIYNVASGNYASVSGGGYNEASGPAGSVSGGSFNTASGNSSSVSGGSDGQATGYASSVSGGRLNVASGYAASVSGGDSNTAGGDYASVSGGLNRSAPGLHDWAAGALFEDE